MSAYLKQKIARNITFGIAVPPGAPGDSLANLVGSISRSPLGFDLIFNKANMAADVLIGDGSLNFIKLWDFANDLEAKVIHIHSFDPSRIFLESNGGSTVYVAWYPS